MGRLRGAWESMRSLFVVSALVVGLVPMGEARAQEGPEPSEGAGATEEERRDLVVVPPRVVTMPPVELSAEGQSAARERTERSVEVVILIGVDGRAEVQECAAAPALCADVARAVAGAVFEPARRGAEAMPARISLRFGLGDVPEEEEEQEEDATAGTPGPSGDAAPGDGATGGASGEVAASGSVPTPAEAAAATPSFGAEATVVRPPAGALRLTLDEARNLPGAFGDPFRAVEALPGVTPIFSGLPYFYVRGSPPSGTLYSYDFINMPLLFHLGLGPSVIHPRMVGPLRLYSGVAPARFGRYIGGVIEAEGPEPTQDSVRGEAELRLLDVNGFVNAPVGEGELMVAARYGYPGLVLSLVSPDTKLSYWDYQLRFRYPLTRRTDAELVALGSFDRLVTTDTETDPVTGRTTESQNALGIHFHRVEARLVHRFAHYEYGVALRFGWGTSFLDESGGDSPERVGVVSTSFGPRFWLAGKREKLAFRVGGELFGAAGRIDVGDMADGADSAAMDPATNQFLASVAARNMAALYSELTWNPSRWMTYDIGFRSDVWLAGGTAEVALDPRLRGTFHLTDELDVHVALGVTRQPAVFFLPLPGLDEVAVARGPQVALQSEAGVAYEPIPELRFELQGFVHRYTNLLFLDLFLDGQTCVEEEIGCQRVQLPERVTGRSYGAELFIRADPELRVSGFLSYTLSWADVEALPGLDYTPSYDVRHVFNLAGRAQLIEDRLSIGFRLHVRTGKPLGVNYVATDTLSLQRYEQRLPTFYRVDAEIAYQWRTRWGRFRLALEWLNVTFTEEPVDLECGDGVLLSAPTSPCGIDYAPAIVLPNLGLRATF